MANINSLTSSNSYGSSYNLYGNRNVLTGLASGMDTEAMIQNSISGYMMKITSLQQSQTKIQWKQDAYRNIIDQMNSILQKYTSYTSKTNLASNAFFTSAVKTETLGKYASAISATGSTKSDIQINSVKQLATAARYAVDAGELDVNTVSEAVGGKINWDAGMQVGQVKGIMTLMYDNEKIELSFDENDVDINTPQGLKEAIEKKLSEVTIRTKSGDSYKASELIDVEMDGSKFTFVSNGKDGSGAKAYIAGLSGNVEGMLGAKRASSSADPKKTDYDNFTVKDFDALVQTQTTAQYLSGKSVEIAVNGVKKTVKIGELEEGATTEDLAKSLQESIDQAFGKGKVEVKVDAESGGLRFDAAKGSEARISVSSSVGEVLGIGKNGVSNFFNTSNTLRTIVGDNLDDYRIAAKGDPESFTTGEDSKGNTVTYDADGNRVMEVVDEEGNSSWYRVNEDGKFLYSVEINGKSVGEFTEDSALESVLTAINNDAESGVKVSYSNLTGQFVFTANETGENGEISFGEGLAQRLFLAKGSNGDLDADNARYADSKSVTYTKGQNAVVEATVNGKDITITRSSNVIDMDGMTVTLKDVFKAETKSEAVTFKTSSDSDRIVDAIKSFVEDINKLMQDIHDAYATMPLKKSSSSKSSSTYDPLTDDDKKDMSESAINAYEEKAKTGLLFGDSDLSQLYSRLLSAIQATGADRIDMESIGLTTTYSDGVTKLALDEDRLRAALESDPDKVRNVFAKTVEGGSKSNGLIASLKAPLNAYGSTSLASPGILVSKAGTKLSAISLMNNHLQKEYDNLEKQIEQWQSRMSDKVDYYTKQFTQLEKLMSTMNNQSSMLASLMGGY